MVYATILPSIFKKKGCDGKQAFAVRADAENSMKQVVKKKHNGFIGGLQVYRCPYCDMFHFGHKSKLMRHTEIPG